MSAAHEFIALLRSTDPTAQRLVEDLRRDLGDDNLFWTMAVEAALPTDITEALAMSVDFDFENAA